ncbi:putative plant SNARE 11 [Diplonema papillatum]|nr:putative plant SNARE 11 [Diplonema papillatum]
MQQVWENETELNREIDALKRQVDTLVANAEGMDPKALKDATKPHNEALRRLTTLLRRQKVDVQFVTKENGKVNERYREELMQQYHAPVQQQVETVKSKLDGLNRLTSQSPVKADMARKELFGGNAPGERDEQELTEMAQMTTVSSVQKTTMGIQQDGIDAAHRGEKLVTVMNGLGTEIAGALASQQEDIELIIDDMDNLQAQVKRARREVGQFSRRLATDKCFMCLFILVLIFIVVVIGLKIFKSDDDPDEDEDLQFED